MSAPYTVEQAEVIVERARHALAEVGGDPQWIYIEGDGIKSHGGWPHLCKKALGIAAMRYLKPDTPCYCHGCRPPRERCMTVYDAARGRLYCDRWAR